MTYLIVILLQIFSYHWFMSSQSFLSPRTWSAYGSNSIAIYLSYFEVSLRVTRNPKGRLLNIINKIIESIICASVTENHLRSAYEKAHRSEYSNILASGSCLSISLKIIPVFSATSAFSYLRGAFSWISVPSDEESMRSVPLQSRKYGFLLGTEIFNCRPTTSNLSP
jgi:hypothetical protein